MEFEMNWTKIISRSVVLAGTIISMVQPASATASMICHSDDDDTSIQILFGAGPVTNIYDISITSGERSYQMGASEPGEQIFIAQSYFDERQIRLDFQDSQALANIVTIHVVRHFPEDGEPLQVGYAKVSGNAAVIVQCDGP